MLEVRPTRLRLRTLVAGIAVTAAIVAAAVVPATAATAAPVAAAATGSPSTCAGSQLNVVAHEDDDLFFLSPNLIDAVTSGQCVTTAYITAGDAGGSASYWQGREAGMRAAYAKMAGVANTWTASPIVLAGTTIQSVTLTAKPAVRLVFLRLPDGGYAGAGYASTGSQSVRKLLQGGISAMTAVDGSATWTLAQLSNGLVSLMQLVGADRVNTQDYTGDYGDGDHDDHHAVAYLTRTASRAYTAAHSLHSYLDYPGASKPANVSGVALTAKSDAYYAYAANDPQTCQSPSACSGTSEETWLARQYVGASEQTGTTAPTPTPTATATPTPTPTASAVVSVNVAGAATVSASSENAADGQTAVKAVDGSATGYPVDYSKEWATQGGTAGSWIQLTWASAQSLARVVLFDRPNSDDQVTSGRLVFSDGSSVTVDSLANDGGATTVDFTARSVTSVRFVVDAVSASTRNVGLAEFQAWTAATTATVPSTAPTPTATPTATAMPTATVTPTPTPTATVTSTTAPSPTATKTAAPTPTPTVTKTATPTPAPVNLALTGAATASSPLLLGANPASLAVDGKTSTEWVTSLGTKGAWLQLKWSTAKSLTSVVLYDRIGTAQQVTGGTLKFSNGATVAVPSLPNDGTPVTVAFPAVSTTSVLFTVTSVSATTTRAGLAELQAFGS